MMLGLLSALVVLAVSNTFELRRREPAVKDGEVDLSGRGSRT
jgi:hypothetical protein